MSWIESSDIPIPRDGQTYFGLRKGIRCLVQWDHDFDYFNVQDMVEGHIAKDERDMDVTHWMDPKDPAE